ncbi:MAG: hypothetical protein K9J37_03950 [Saprospiraceae bacterium]|nr:hypothetical protein [Saprospiraceae bacterium]MCF8249038.1 hypothetical protein [Saprospiraceae bacterium]MCF8282663.1 hypothetical protein [Bacteroidales bacterium]MCF8311060.1 hypothetical protein [Saprospiraceae bacterium]
MKDINLGASASINPQNITEVNGVVFFTANDGINGRELWKSNGTSAGTVLVKDVYPGAESSNPSNLTNVNGVLFFSAYTITNGYELWKSDGTTSGTVLIDINPGSQSSSPINFSSVGGMLFFSAPAVGTENELWKSDGTSAGTVMVKDINPGVGGAYPSNLTNVNGMLFFSADNGTNGSELWKSDGTSAGTVMVKDIYPGSGHSNINNLTNVNGMLFFSADNGTNGSELWKSDGTSAGTVMVKDIRTGVSSSSLSNFTDVNNVLYCRANNGTNGIELWKSDGTSAGTVMVKDIYPGSSSSNISNLTNLNGVLLFRATDGTNGIELWKSDGTSSGTAMVKDIYPGINNSNPTYLINVNGLLYFTATDGVSGFELWKSDGTISGTTLVKDIYPGITNSSLLYLTSVNGEFYFSANDGINGTELWKSNGTNIGTEIVFNFLNTSQPSLPWYHAKLGGELYFNADDGNVGRELWKSDGTLSGTVLVKDIRQGAGAGANPNYLTNMNEVLYFSAYDDIGGTELWKSDGTAAGTVMVKDIRQGASGSTPSYLTNMNGLLYFVADDGVSSRELWKSDGTASGTVMVKDISPGVNGSYPSNLTNVNGVLYFTANDGINGLELWKSDGTSSGTVMVKDIYPGINNSNPNYLTNINGLLYFTANDGVTGIELWRSDGTVAGTAIVKDILIGSGNSSPDNLTNVNGTLYFSANDGINGIELWKSNGFAVGTILIKDIQAGSIGSDPTYLVNINGELYFRAFEQTNGNELWKSDGTESGTTMVKDIQSGTSSSNPGFLTNVNGTLYFNANDGINGYELWKSYGTASGTTLVDDIHPGGNSGPGYMKNMDGVLFFDADDGIHGFELWRTSGSCLAQTWYLDADADGYGDPDQAISPTCTQPSGYVDNDADCDDSDPLEYPVQAWFIDADGDNYGASVIVQCERPANGKVLAELAAGSTGTDDCNDSDPNEFPGQTWYIDADSDDYGAYSVVQCSRPTTTNFSGGNEEKVKGDTAFSSAKSTIIGYLLSELSGNGTDDCNDADADEFPGQSWFIDADGDDYGGSSVVQCGRPANGYVLAELASGSTGTDDCDDTDVNEFPNQTWYPDADMDGWGGSLISQCERPIGYFIIGELANGNNDCDDNDANEFPGQNWYPDSDMDGWGGSPTTQCERPTGYFLLSELNNGNGDCDDTDPIEHPGQIWFIDADNDNYGVSSITQCERPTSGKTLAELAAGSTGTDDCDDTDANEHPGQTWYIDADGDDYGISSLTQCERPTNGKVLAELAAGSTGTDDCDDTDANEHPGQTWYIDADNDDYGISSVTQCERPTNGKVFAELAAGSTGTDDCDDTDPIEFPGQTWYVDADDDDYGASSIIQCERPTNGFLLSELSGTGTDDCNDTNADIHPGAIEVCNGLDDDCDGTTDEGVTITYYADVDGDTYGDPAMTMQACTAPSGYVSDNTDCDDTDANEYPGQTWYPDVDVDGWGGAPNVQCERPAGFFVLAELTNGIDDCDDADPLEFPGQTWFIDADDDDYGVYSIEQCERPTNGFLLAELAAGSTGTDDCNDADPLEFPGQTWFIDADDDDYGVSAIGQCERPVNGKILAELAAGSSGTDDCDDANATINPGASEACNGLDDDCDGVIDEEAPDTWAVQASGTSNGLSTLWVADANNAWAVGDAGTILYWDGSAWSAQTSGTSDNLSGVWGLSATDVWAVGQNGTIRHWDGTAWSGQTSGTSNWFYDVWGIDATHVWAVGQSGVIRMWDGTSWTTQSSPTSTNIYDVWGPASNNVWAVGHNGIIHKWNGSSWSSQTPLSATYLACVWGTDANNVWTVGSDGLIFKWNGSAWTAQTSGTSQYLSGLWGVDANNIWVVGGSGTIKKYNGTSWNTQTSGTSSALNDVYGADPDNVWVSGASGLILNYSGVATWYPDVDNDGFGDMNAGIPACIQPTNYIADGTDCDDTNADVHPGATEILNGLDDDCNGYTDENSFWVSDPAFNNTLCNDCQPGDMEAISDGMGGMIAVWVQGSNGAGTQDIYAQRIDANGNALWGCSGILVSGAAENQGLPKLTNDGSNGAIITWIDHRNEPIPNGSYIDIYAQRINSAGVVQWTADGIPVCEANGGQLGPVISEDGNGGCYIVWNDQRPNAYGLYGQRIDAGGNIQWTQNGVVLLSNTSCDCSVGGSGIDIVSNGSGEAIIAFQTTQTNDPDKYVKAIRFDGTGDVVWSTLLFSDNINLDYVQIVTDGAGGGIVSFNHRNGGNGGNGSSDHIYAQRVDASGVRQWGTISDPIPICQTLAFSNYQPLVADGNGGAILAWVDYRTGNGTTDIYSQKINASGQIQWPSNGILVKNSIYAGWGPTKFLVSNGAGGAFVGLPYYSELRVQQISSSGSLLWGGNGKLVSNAGSAAFVLVNDNNCETTLGFFRTGSDDFVASKISCAGNLIGRDAYVRLSPKAFLQGPYNAGLMSDNLRSASLIPTTEPYTGLGFTHVGGGGGEMVASSVFTTTGNNALVDWVFLQLRDKNNSATVLHTRSALVQRDGDIVDVDGVSPVFFAGRDPDDYFITVKHRNHLGVMSANALSASMISCPIDFTTGMTQAFGTNPMVNLGNSSFGLWAGDANGDGKVYDNLVPSDAQAISGAVLGHPGNTGFFGSGPVTNFNGFINAYERTDINMDGKVYDNLVPSDRQSVSSNVLGHPANTGFFGSGPVTNFNGLVEQIDP